MIALRSFHSVLYQPQHDRKKGLFQAKNLDTRNANIWRRARFRRNLWQTFPQNTNLENYVNNQQNLKLTV
jgi:hypothetical protein